ncbi:hypothetical protein AMTRI_Chr10g227930 [Amborella trichopoda]
MDPRKDNAFSKGKGKVSKLADNGGEEEAPPLFPRVRHFPEGLPSHISQGLRLGEVPRLDWLLSIQQWLELMAFFASVLMIGILNMASCHVNFPLLEALAERFNYQMNPFFLPSGETMPTLEEIARVSSLSLVGISYQPSIATDDHSIMGAQLLGAANSSHASYTIVPVVLAGIYQGLHDRVMRGDQFIEGSPGIPYFYHKNLLKKARTEPGGSELGDIGGVTRIWAHEHIAIFLPPRSTIVVSAALVLVYVNDTTQPQYLNYYRRVFDELSSFNWVIRSLENVPLFLPSMGCSCLILAGQVLRQFHHTQHYTSPGEAIDRHPIFPLRRHSSTLVVKVGLSWKGKKSSSSEGLAKQDKPTTTSNYNSWCELCPKALRLRDEYSTPTRDLMSSREDDA